MMIELPSESLKKRLHRITCDIYISQNLTKQFTVIQKQYTIQDSQNHYYSQIRSPVPVRAQVRDPSMISVALTSSLKELNSLFLRIFFQTYRTQQFVVSFVLDRAGFKLLTVHVLGSV